jgi:PKD repeat protein
VQEPPALTMTEGSVDQHPPAPLLASPPGRPPGPARGPGVKSPSPLAPTMGRVDRSARAVAPLAGFAAVLLLIAYLPGGPISSAPPGGSAQVAVIPATCPRLGLSINATPTNGTAPLNVSFSSNISGGCAPYEIQWQFGDGGQSLARNPHHIYRSAGTFNVNVEASDSSNQEREAELSISVAGGAGQPTIAVVADPPSGSAPLATTFWANVTGGNLGQNLSIRWDFGDGGNGTGTPIPYVYRVAGNYTATATVFSGGNRVGDASVPIEVTAPIQKPPANLTLSAVPSVLAGPGNVTVVAYSGGQAGPYQLRLCFGDGSPCANGTPGWTGIPPFAVGHDFLLPGNFTVVGTLTNASGGLVASATAGVEVEAGPALDVVASVAPVRGVAPFTTHFTAAVTGGTAPYVVQWLFGDGTYGSSVPGTPVGHLYPAVGTYAVSVVIRDASGHWANRSVGSVAVTAPPASSPLTTSVAGIPGWALIVVLLLAAVGVGVLTGRRWRERARQRRLRREGEEIVRELEEGT